jgi:photosystem II stability/assembly factor-like uncharacterized protein
MALRRLAVLALIAVALPLQAAHWIPHGPIGAHVTAFAVHDSTVYAGTYGAGLFRSGDAGQSWIEINDSVTGRAFVYSIACDAAGTVYAMTNLGLFSSHDRGSSWTTFSTQYNDIAGGLVVDGSTLYAFGRPWQIARTTDGGATWQPIINGLDHNALVDGVAVHGNTLIAAMSSGIFRSSDSGANWTPVLATTATAVQVLAGGTLLAGTVGFGVLRSTDDGRTWIGSNSGLNDSARISPVIDIVAGPDATVYLASNVGGAARSVDGGLTWTMMNDGFVPEPPNISAIALAGSTELASTTFGVFRRREPSIEWQPAAGLPGTGSIFSISSDPSTTWAIDEGTIDRSEDGGVSWIQLRASQYSTIVADPRKAGSAFAGTARLFGAPQFFHPTIESTVDGGAHWNVLWTGESGTAVQTLAADARAPQSIFAGLNNGLIRSRDGGQTWSDVLLRGESVVSIAFDSLNVSSMFAATASGVFLSRDGGTTWTRTITSRGIAVASTLRFAYAATDSGLYSSIDHGATWTRVANAPAQITAIASASPDRLFAASAGDVYELRDHVRWTRPAESPIGFPIPSLQFQNETLIAGTSGRGVLVLNLAPRTRAARPRP